MSQSRSPDGFGNYRLRVTAVSYVKKGGLVWFLTPRWHARGGTVRAPRDRELPLPIPCLLFITGWRRTKNSFLATNWTHYFSIADNKRQTKIGYIIQGWFPHFYTLRHVSFHLFCFFSSRKSKLSWSTREFFISSKTNIRYPRDLSRSLALYNLLERHCSSID